MDKNNFYIGDKNTKDNAEEDKEQSISGLQSASQ